jgi:aerobic carbon-monoxide dehydrogenase large subunit
MSLWGTPVLRREDARFLTGSAQYVADLDLPGAAWVTFVTSTIAHGVLGRVDVTSARAAPGVLAAFAADDLDVGPYPPAIPGFPAAMAWPMLAATRVRYVGEPVAVVVAESEALALDAAEAVVVDIDPLPVLVDPAAALDGEVVLFEGATDNIALHQDGGRPASDMAGFEVVVRATVRNNRVAPCPLETRAAAAAWQDGRLVHWSSCQGVHPVRDLLAQVYGLDPAQVRVITPDVGGSFGAKARPTPEELLLAWLSRAVDRPVRWIPSRSADMVGLGHSRAQIQHVTLAGDRDGTMRAAHVHVIGDSGAYPFVGAFLPRNTGLLLNGCYRLDEVTWSADAVVTNTTPTTAYRGAGRPEAAAAIERVVDMFAAELGLDPVELRRRNLLRPEEFPHQTPTGLTYDSGDYRRALDMALDQVGYDSLRAEQRRRREAGSRHLLGIGVATFLDRTAGVPGTEYGGVELRSDGSVLVRTGSSPYGQGHHTSWAMLVSDRLGLPLDRIEVVHGDTDLVPRGGITGGSRSVQKAGSAVAVAADDLVERGREVAADLLEAAAADVVLDTALGAFHVQGTPARAVPWDEIAAARTDDPLACEADYSGDASFPSGAYVAVVEVDAETGLVRLQRMVTVDDAGRILNPMLALGQVHGGLAQGIGQALYEEVVFDADGNPRTANLADYAFPSAAELPSFEASLVETPSPNNVLGAKGIGESGTIGAPPAVQNAVVDALAHLGVRHLDMPLTPQRVWETISAGRS